MEAGPDREEKRNTLCNIDDIPIRLKQQQKETYMSDTSIPLALAQVGERTPPVSRSCCDDCVFPFAASYASF